MLTSSTTSMLETVGTSYQLGILTWPIEMSNLHVPIPDASTFLNLCFVLVWLLGVSCILCLTYKFVRNYTYVTVNCWFCNENTRILFKEKREWICPQCEQFNGFDKDGGYSRYIPEQYDEQSSSRNMNTRASPTNTFSRSHSNGLCRTCNANQELKMRQIASYVPLKEENYDQEIQIFMEKLERSYKLCPVCVQTVQSTLKLKSRQYCAENVPKSNDHVKTPLTKRVSVPDGHLLMSNDRTGKWKHGIGLFCTTIFLMLLGNYCKFHEYVNEYGSPAKWPVTFDQLWILGENGNFFLNIVVLISAALFTKNYFGKVSSLSLLIFGILSFMANDYVSKTLKVICVIFALLHRVYEYLKGRRPPVNSEKCSKKYYESDLKDVDDGILAGDKAKPDVPLWGELSDLSLGRTHSVSSIPKSSYLFKPSKLLVQPAKLILDDPDESTDTVRSFRTVSSGYDSVNSFLRKSVDSISEFDSVSQVGLDKRSPNALVPWSVYQRTYTPACSQFYGVTSVAGTDRRSSPLSAPGTQVSAFFSALQIFLCSFAFFVLGFSLQLLVSNLKF